ncbi:ABC transporter substrate-binding protein [Shewanella olleyana]|uniref:MlaC/ttg2D family ABC transporter substrate-binding protein n=1 Tax=Shewanella olleyana TaxID=135626 RepID=UPI00200FB8E8|nr:ABC transporter substrate-binding protein [Shewanella olleyana]MCL1066836.1 ABC transporter substrate-binding protein [Shewanella olleyana]
MSKLLQPFMQTLIFVAASIFTFSTVAAEEIDTHDPFKLVQQVSNKTFDRFDTDKALIDADLGHLKVIVREELMPYVDYKYAAYKVMGQYLRDTTPEQRERFVEAFEGYLVATYAQAFTEYTNQKVQFSPATDFTDEKFVDVNVQIIEDGRPPIKVIFKARRLKDDSWKAFDLVAEGVSLLASKQSEVSNLIRQKGVDSVIEMLKERTDQEINYKQDKENAA